MVADLCNSRVAVFCNSRVAVLCNDSIADFCNGCSFLQLQKMAIADMNFSTKALHTIIKGVDSLWSNRTL